MDDSAQKCRSKTYCCVINCYNNSSTTDPRTSRPVKLHYFPDYVKEKDRKRDAINTLVRRFIGCLVPLCYLMIYLPMQADTMSNATDACNTYAIKERSGHSSNPDDHLHILGIFHSDPARGQLDSALLAVELVNQKQIIPGFSIFLDCIHVKCKEGLSVYHLFEALNADVLDPYLMVLGPACPEDVEATAFVTRQYKLVHIFYGTEVDGLTNEIYFPNLARIIMPSLLYTQARVSLLQHFGWTRVCVLYKVDVNAQFIESLLKWLKDSNITIIKEEFFAEDPRKELLRLKESDCRILLGVFAVGNAPEVLCEAHNLGLTGSKQVWILPGRYQNVWWHNVSSIPCGEKNIAEALEGTIHLDLVSDAQKETASGWTADKFREEFEKVAGPMVPFDDVDYTETFDIIWAMALTLSQLAAEGYLTNFTYRNKNTSRQMFKALANISFSGIGGPVSFQMSGSVTRDIGFYRVQEGTPRHFATFHPVATNSNPQYVIYTSNEKTKKVQFSFNGTLTVFDNVLNWKGGLVPADGKMVRHKKVPTILYFPVCLAAGLGVLEALVFILFNCCYSLLNSTDTLYETPRIIFWAIQEVWVVKTPSTCLNNLLLLGCILCFASVVILDNGQQWDLLGCQIKLSVVSLGCTLTFGTMVVKLWKTHTLVKKTHRVRSMPSIMRVPDQARTQNNMHLLLLILSVTVIAQAIWFALDTFYFKETEFNGNHDEDCPKEDCTQMQLFCTSQNWTAGVLGVYGTLMIVIGICAILAFEALSADLPMMNETKYVAMASYFAAFMCLPYVIIDSMIEEQVLVSYAGRSIVIIFGALTTQSIIFIPKIRALFHGHISPVAMLRSSSSTRRRSSNLLGPATSLKELGSNLWATLHSRHPSDEPVGQPAGASPGDGPARTQQPGSSESVRRYSSLLAVPR